MLQAALATRDRYQAGAVSDHGLAVARGHYVERLAQLLQRTPSRRLFQLPTYLLAVKRC
jgi:hypothetical protein